MSELRELPLKLKLELELQTRNFTLNCELLTAN